MNPKPVSSLCLTPSGTLRNALEIIDKGRAGICLMVDEGQHLLGTINDGGMAHPLPEEAALGGARLAGPRQPDHLSPAHQAAVKLPCPVTEDLFKNNLSLPSCSSSSDGDIERVCAVIASRSQPPTHPFHVLHRQQRGLAAHLTLMLVQQPLPPSDPL